MQPNRSRLARKEGQRMMKQTFVIIIVSLLLIVALFVLGIPALIRFAAFLGEVRSTSEPVPQQQSLAPYPPQVESLPIATASATISIKGYARPDTIVSLYKNEQKVKETAPSESGEFVFSGVQLDSGNNNFYTTATSNEQESAPSSKVSIIFDNQAPELEITEPEDGEEIFGQLKRNINVRGTTDPEAEIRVNGQVGVVSSTGSFSVPISLQDGSNEIKIVAQDEAGNITEKTINVSYTP